MSNNLGRETGEQSGPTKIWNPQFTGILIANAVMNLCQYMTNSLLPKFIDSMGMPAATVGILMSSFTFTLLIFRFVAGPVMDTYNNKRIATTAMIGLAAAFAGFALSKSVSTIVIFRLLQGAVMAFGNSCCMALATDTLPKDKYASGIGYFSLGMVIGQTLGPMVGLELLDRFGYQTTYFVIAATSLLSAFLASRIKYNFTRIKKLKISFKNAIAKEALLPSVLLTLLFLVSASIGSFLILFSEKQGITQNIGLYFTVNALAMLLTRPLSGKLADRYGFIKVFVPSMFLGVAAFIIISFSNTIWLFLVAAVLSAISFGACAPLAQSQTMKGVADERKGIAIATNGVFMDIGAFSGSNLAGVLVQAFGYPVMWNCMIVPLVLAACITLFARKSINRAEESFNEKYAKVKE